MTKEEAKKLYKDKFFYEIIKDKDHIKLYGPRDDIYYVSRHWPKTKGAPNIEFVQVIDGVPKETFTKEEILVTKKRIGE